MATLVSPPLSFAVSIKVFSAEIAASNLRLPLPTELSQFFVLVKSVEHFMLPLISKRTRI